MMNFGMLVLMRFESGVYKCTLTLMLISCFSYKQECLLLYLQERWRTIRS